MIMPIIKISHKCVCGRRIGQGRAGERPKSLTGLHQRTWAPAALSQREGRKGSQDWLITDLIYCFWPPVFKAPSGLSAVYAGDCFYLSCYFSRVKLSVFVVPNPGWAEERWYLPVFREAGKGLAAALGCASSLLQPRGLHGMSREPLLSSGYCCMGDPWARFHKRSGNIYYCYLYCLYY